jgi:hypothetical protein
MGNEVKAKLVARARFLASGQGDPHSATITELCDFIEASTRIEPEAADRGVSEALADIAAERARQIEVEGWTPEHDDKHGKGELVHAAECYIARAPRTAYPPPHWPWDRDWWKPKDRRSNLVRAGALIAAEIERLDRAAIQSLRSEQEDGR